jgi:hypothetical protein
VRRETQVRRIGGGTRGDEAGRSRELGRAPRCAEARADDALPTRRFLDVWDDEPTSREPTMTMAELVGLRGR